MKTTTTAHTVALMVLLASLTNRPFLSGVSAREDLFQEHHHKNHDGHDHDHDDNDHEDHRCATEHPSLREELIDNMRFKQAFGDDDDDTNSLDFTGRRGRRQRHLQIGCDEVCDQCIEIETYLHLIEGNVTGFGPLIPHPTETVRQLLRDDDRPSFPPELFSTEDDVKALFQDNIDVVNRAFRGTPFRFRFVPENTTRSLDNDWVNSASSYQAEMSQAVGNGDLRKLDVFVAWNVRANSTGTVLGIASLPGAQLEGRGDGVILRYDVLTGGGAAQNDLGYTLVHEIGHWLGLLHTFQQLVSTDPCDPDENGFGDFVDDTPIQDGPSSRQAESCRVYLGGGRLPDTCPDLDGNDAIFNYMNYVDDEICQQEQGEFSCGQIEKMTRNWYFFRDRITSCADPNEMEIEILIELDRDYTFENRFILATADGDILFNSREEHFLSLVIFDVETTLIDRCVPRNQDYVLLIGDDFGDGFVDGSIEVRVDGVLIERISGNFGSLARVDIPAQEGTPVPFTGAPTTSTPSFSPTSAPTREPTLSPTSQPTLIPTETPTEVPSARPTTQFPTASPDNSLNGQSSQLTSAPTITPQPTTSPTANPQPVNPTTIASLESLDPSSSASSKTGHLLMVSVVAFGFVLFQI